jgi:hypothetical protein
LKNQADKIETVESGFYMDISVNSKFYCIFHRVRSELCFEIRLQKNRENRIYKFYQRSITLINITQTIQTYTDM